MNINKETMQARRDKGFTLVELLIVVVILGILATVTVFAVRGITDKGQESACDTDKRGHGNRRRNLVCRSVRRNRW